MKRWVRPTVILVALLMLGVGVMIFFTGRGDRTDSSVRETRYNSRDLLIPQVRYLLPDIEHELIHPSLRYAVDPDAPLPVEILRESRQDPREALRNELMPQVQQAVEDLLFE